MEESSQKENLLFQYVQVVDGNRCNDLYSGYIQVLKNNHPSRPISVRLRVTSSPPNDDATGQRISYLKEPIVVAAKSSYNIACDVPGPTSQRFFYVPEIVKWAD